MVFKSVERLGGVSTGKQCDLRKKFPTTENELASAILTKAYEQLVMERRTGHRSLEGVRSYKRTDEQQ